MCPALLGLLILQLKEFESCVSLFINSKREKGQKFNIMKKNALSMSDCHKLNELYDGMK